MPATIRRKLYEIEEPAITVNDLCNRVARIIMIEKLVPEKDFATAFNEINSQPTRSEDFNFLQAQQQSLQETQQAIVSQIAQISSQLKSIEVQRQHFAGTEIHRKEIHKYLSNSNNNLLVRSIIILIPRKIEKKNLFYPTMNKPKEQNPLFYIQIVIGNLKFDALVDTGSFTNASPMRIFNQIADSIVSANNRNLHSNWPKGTMSIQHRNTIQSRPTRIQIQIPCNPTIEYTHIRSPIFVREQSYG